MHLAVLLESGMNRHDRSCRRLTVVKMCVAETRISDVKRLCSVLYAVLSTVGLSVKAT